MDRPLAKSILRGQFAPLARVRCNRPDTSLLLDNGGTAIVFVNPVELEPVVAAEAQARLVRNAGMTSSATHWNCSSIVACGVPIGLDRLMYCMPG